MGTNISKSLTPDTVIISGGGVKTIAHCGVLIELQNNGFTFRRFIGTSGGAIIACFLAVGITIQDILEILRNCNFEELLDHDLISIPAIYDLCTDLGENTGNKFVNWLRTTFINHNLDPNMTFKDLKDTELEVNAVDIVSGHTVIFSKNTSPDMPVLLAVRASMSIPFLFQPVKLSCNLLNPLRDTSIKESSDPLRDTSIKESSDPLRDTSIKEESMILIDGGTLENCLFSCDNDLAIILNLQTANTKKVLNKSQYSTVTSFGTRVFDLIYEQAQNYYHLTASQKERLISIPVPDIPITCFKISPEEITYLLEAGKLAVKNWIK